MFDDARAQWSYTYPGPGRELEVLNHPTIEQQTLFWMLWVHECEGITQSKEAFLVERCARQICLPPVARRNVGAEHPGFQLAVFGQELERDPWSWDADVARAIEIACAGKGEGCGLRRSKT